MVRTPRDWPTASSDNASPTPKPGSGARSASSVVQPDRAQFCSSDFRNPVHSVTALHYPSELPQNQPLITYTSPVSPSPARSSLFSTLGSTLAPAEGLRTAIPYRPKHSTATMANNDPENWEEEEVEEAIRIRRDVQMYTYIATGRPPHASFKKHQQAIAKRKQQARASSGASLDGDEDSVMTVGTAGTDSQRSQVCTCAQYVTHGVSGI